MKKYSYYIRARLFPTLLTSIPALVLINNIISPLYYNSLAIIYEVLPLITNLGLYTAIIFLSVQINRFVAKEVFQKWFFQDELKMPTTECLLCSDHYYEDTIKTKIRQKIYLKYEIALLEAHEEQIDVLKARKMIVTAVALIRNSLVKYLYQYILLRIKGTKAI